MPDTILTDLKTSACLPPKHEYEKGLHGPAGSFRLYRTAYGYTVQIRSLGGTLGPFNRGAARFVRSDIETDRAGLERIAAAIRNVLDAEPVRGRDTGRKE